MVASTDLTMLTYCIIEFIEENTIEIIPSSWLSPDKKTAFWPKSLTPSVLKKHLKFCTKPESSWPSVNIRILGQAENLVDAERKAQKAQDTSQLSSDSEYDYDIPLTRHKKLSYRFRDTSDEEIVERPKKQHENLGSKRPIVPPFPEFQDSTAKIVEKNIETYSSNVSTSAIENKSSNIVRVERKKDHANKGLNYIQNSTDFTQETVIESVQSSSSIFGIQHTTDDITPGSQVPSNKKETNFRNTKEILIKIFKLIEEVKFEVTESRKEQQEIKIQLNCLLTAKNEGSFNKFCKILPMSSMASFDEVENYLITSDNDYASLIQYLSLANGETVQRLVPSIMKLLMKKSVTIQFSGCGRKKKRDFSVTKIAAAVYEIVLQKLPDSSKDAISKKISKFLAESTDREGGRKQRFTVTE